MKKLFAIVLSVCLLLTFALAEGAQTTASFEKGKLVEVTMVIKDLGEVKLELYPDHAPQSVANFVALAKAGFYDGLSFHRVIKDFMVQGGDPKGTGAGGPGYSIKGEFADNGVKNDIPHVRGAISWARAQVPNSAGSQFFIVHKDSNFLDGKYAAFGMVVSGIEVIDKIAETKTDGSDKPIAPVIIEKVTIDNEVELPELEKLEEQ